MKQYAKIGHLTYIGRINNFSMGLNSVVGHLNWISGLNKASKAFQYSIDRQCEMVLADNVSITSKHLFDCNGGIYIGEYTTVAGHHTTFLSHSIDVEINRQTAGPIIVGNFCFISTNCILLKGSILPSYCVLAAGAVLNKKYTRQYTLYAGVPATIKKELTFNYKYFTRDNRVVD